jgi:single-strand DNA-binding protein
LNSFNGIGRLTRDPELKYSGNNKAYCNFSIAIERSFNKPGEEKQADFINCTVFGATAEKFVSVYFKKGMRVGISGELRIDKDEKDGNVRYFTKIIVQRAYFADGKSEPNETSSNMATTDVKYEDVEGSKDTLPF